MEGYFRKREKAWENPSWRNLLGTWATVPLFVLLIYSWNADRETAKRQKVASATIVAQDPSNHQCYEYAFRVKSASYSGCEFPQHPAIGNEIQVFYDPQNPTRNHVNDFNEVSEGELPFVPIPILIPVALGIFIWLKRRSYRTAKERAALKEEL